ncbi:MAG TPA: TPM domain-containing protein [Methyloversatilis sp.]
MLVGVAFAQVAVPPLTARVIDQTATLSAGTTAALDKTLQAFEARKGSQIAVLIVPTTAPETIEQYALRVAETWKLGRKGVDDGALLLVARDDRALRIEVGYGLEGALTDITAKRIVSDIITPYFRRGDFDGGVSAGVTRMIAVIDGEALPPPAVRASARADDIGSYAPLLFIVALFMGGVLRSVLGRLPGALVTGGVVGFIAWTMVGALSVAILAGVIALFVTLFGGGRGIGGGFGGGGGGYGGGGGGGFSGGGGGFGGGGASGRW